METLRFQTSGETARRIRKMAMETYGHSKGSISKAMNKAAEDWTRKFETKTHKPILLHKLRGLFAKTGDSAMEAEEKAVRLMGKVD